MKSCTLFRKHNWITVAIDTSNGWTKTSPKTNKITFSENHIIKFMCCKNCGGRSIMAVDANPDGVAFAMKEHNGIALQRAIWEDTGKITGYLDDKINWVDSSYAPLRSVDAHINAIKKDKDFKELMKSHSMVDDAMEQLEVAIKLCNNNTPQDTP
jgi:hypothetical protein